MAEQDNAGMSSPDDLDANEDWVAKHWGEFSQERRWLGLDLDDEAPESSLRGARDTLRAQLPSDELLVMLDSSTLEGARGCVYYSSGNPLALLELSILTFALLCYDRIVVQPHGPYFDFLQDLGDAVITLTYPNDFAPSTLWSLVVGLERNSLGTVTADLDTFANAWSAFLYGEEFSSSASRPEISLNLNAYNRYTDSPGRWNGILAEGYNYALFGVSDLDPENSRERDEYLSLQTVRTLFNDRLAGYLQVPYLASSFRAPIQSLLLARKAETQFVVDRVLAALGPPAAASSALSGPYMAELSAPFLLGLVMERMQTPADYWSVVAEYRQRFAPLRRQIVRDRAEWDGRSGQYLKKLLEPLAAAGVEYERTLDSTAIVAGAVATAVRPDVAVAGAAIKLARTWFPEDRVRRWFYRRFRPELHLLFSLSDEAAKLRAVEGQVKSIWGHGWDRDAHDLLERLAAAQPPDFARLRSLA